MANKWFVQKEETVLGPFTAEAVQTAMSAGQLAPEDLIWRAGQESWRTLHSWSNDSGKDLSEATVTEITTDTWYYAAGGNSHGPMSYLRLLETLKTLANVNDAMIWTKGMSEWAPVYEFHELLTDLGVNKRQYPRADVDGKVIVHSGARIFIARLLSISEGGVGIELRDSGLVSGEPLSVEIQSSAFREGLNAKCEVRYVGDSGVVGLKFTSLSVEAKSSIIQFLKQGQVRFTIKAA